MIESYIEQHDAGYWIKGTRVSLDSVVYRWNLRDSLLKASQKSPMRLRIVYVSTRTVLIHSANSPGYGG